LNPASIQGTSIELHPAKDNTLFESATGAISNGSGPALFVGNNSSSNTRRALIAFDVTDSIPSGATINSAELRLHVSNAPNAIPRTITLHNILADWGEGASSAGGGGGAAAQTGDATWLHTFYPSFFWLQAGGDFNASILASTVVGEEGFCSWSDSAMAAAVQVWLDNPGSNFGWLLLGEEFEAATARRFDSRENGTVEFRPLLIIDFTPANVPVEQMSWGSMKAVFRGN
jgi:hypothetical protein